MRIKAALQRHVDNLNTLIAMRDLETVPEVRNGLGIAIGHKITWLRELCEELGYIITKCGSTYTIIPDDNGREVKP